jgi:hypothetical protein
MQNALAENRFHRFVLTAADGLNPAPFA